jgi:hypothetical protein
MHSKVLCAVSVKRFNKAIPLSFSFLTAAQSRRSFMHASFVFNKWEAGDASHHVGLRCFAQSL